MSLDSRAFTDLRYSNNFLKTVVDQKPRGYETPLFPSLYWPFPYNGIQDIYLYDAEEMFLFTLYWTLICIVAVHVVAAGYAVTMQYQNWKLVWVVPIVYISIGGIEALIAGSVVGGL